MERENASISSVVISAGGSPSEEETGDPAPPEKDKTKVAKATREDMLRKLKADIKRYEWKREREFGRENGYCFYSPVSSEASEEGDDNDSEAVGEAELSPRSFPLVTRTRARRGAVSRGGLGAQTQSNRAGDPHWVQNSTGAFGEYLTRTRTVEDRDQELSEPVWTSATTERDDQTPTTSRAQREQRTSYRLAFRSPPAGETTNVVLAAEDGIDLRRARTFIRRRHAFLTEWSPPSQRPETASIL